MTNTLYSGVHYVDLAGIISKVPVYVEGILFVPHAITDVLDLNFWDEGNAVSDSEIFFSASGVTGTITESVTTNDTLTAARLPATNVIKVLEGSGTVDNHTYHLIGTAGDNDKFIVDPTTSWTDEATKKYHTKTYPARPFFNCTCTGITNDFSSQYYPLGGVYVPNLICEAITSGAYAIIYTR
jgi:hypothetical protein